MSTRVIFKKIHAISGDTFICVFNAFKSPLFYNHHNHEGDVIIIPFAMGTHQSDPWGGGGWDHSF